MYSTVNIALVVRDLSRHPRGDRLARDLRHAFALDETALATLDAAPVRPDDAGRRDALLRQVADEPRALEVLAAARQVADVAGLAAWTSSLGVLEAAPMGGGPELLHWLDDEVLRVAWSRVTDVAVDRWPAGTQAVRDGVLASYVGTDLAGDLGLPWRRWTADHEPAAVDDPAAAHVVAMLTKAEPAALAAAGTALRTARADGWSWAHAMHDACWAVDITGRGRSAAVAQLAALEALMVHARGGELAADVVAAVTAAMHATVVADVLASDVLAAMCRPLLAHVG